MLWTVVYLQTLYKANLMKQHSKCIFVIILLMISFNNYYSQYLDVGLIRGSIKLKEFDEIAPFAKIVVDSLPKEYYSDIDGCFVIESIPVGIYSLNVSYAGWPDSKIDSIRVTKNVTTKIEVIIPTYEDVYENQANIDIKNNEPKLYLGGWPIFETPLETMNKIAKKYGFQYVFDGGCDPTTFYWSKYNKVVKDYLAQKHGPNWESNIKNEIKEARFKFEPEYYKADSTFKNIIKSRTKEKLDSLKY
jgi:hypothetical protein